MSKITKKINEPSQVNSLEASLFESEISKPLKVLITRPEAKAQQLATLLDILNIESTSQPLFDYQPYATPKETSIALKQANILIFVSAAAVNYANASCSLINNDLLNNPSLLIFAVGNATKQALLSLGITNVLSPPYQEEHSEGLLKLPELNNVAGKKVLIIRGNGGREHIAETLHLRGANVNYIESYQRVWRTLTKNIAKQWHATQINCIVVTSNDILVALLDFLTNVTDSQNDYWQKKCLWIVVSDRIEINAKKLGLVHVVNTHSASSQRLCDTLQALSCT